jgi:hypothetical protein
METLQSICDRSVELTPEMIGAGVSALESQVNVNELLFSAEDIVSDVFRAMSLAAPK